MAHRLLDAGASGADTAQCSALLTTQLVGVIYARYVLAVDAVATLPARDFPGRYAPALAAVIEQCLAVDI